MRLNGGLGLCAVLTICWGGCGWKVGRATSIELELGAVGGPTIEPGLRGEVQSRLVDVLRMRGVKKGGDRLAVELLDSGHSPMGRTDGGGTIGFTARLGMKLEIAEREGCMVEVWQTRDWVLPPNEPLGGAHARWTTLQDMVAVLVEQGVDQLLWKRECQ